MNLLGTFQPRLPIIGCNPFCYYLMVLNWHCNRQDREFKKTCIHFIPCSARTISSFCQTIIFFCTISIHCGGSSSSVCDGEHFVLKIHKLLLLFDLVFKKYPSCSHPLHRPCQPYSLSACHLSMLHHHGLTRTALCLSKKLVAKTAYHVMS